MKKSFEELAKHLKSQTLLSSEMDNVFTETNGNCGKIISTNSKSGENCESNDCN